MLAGAGIHFKDPRSIVPERVNAARLDQVRRTIQGILEILSAVGRVEQDDVTAVKDDLRHRRLHEG